MGKRAKSSGGSTQVHRSHKRRFRAPEPPASSGVRISYLPGFEPNAERARFLESRQMTKLPFLATIVTSGRAYQVEVSESGMRFVRHL